MFFIISKSLPYLLDPVIWLLVLLVGALLSGRRPARQRGLVLAALVLLFIGTNGGLVNEAALAWELPPVRLRTIAPTTRACCSPA
ncbi:hypothetical protein [Hymenobacter cellulosilyticus]|uniref:Uncharacterized protein n=1 Tax=Hymenobacter cellulosilyticus TaxID=2932248 RepID=A0A8T9Q0Z1_9BACT|nr:hypothetical protein [Hymenobacter cellulosilyticus]UOQ70552.1 hypothetical protein MUN79_17750 [Hymenobacter cellulosilyticus]